MTWLFSTSYLASRSRRSLMYSLKSFERCSTCKWSFCQICAQAAMTFCLYCRQLLCDFCSSPTVHKCIASRQDQKCYSCKKVAKNKCADFQCKQWFCDRKQCSEGQYFCNVCKIDKSVRPLHAETGWLLTSTKKITALKTPKSRIYRQRMRMESRKFNLRQKQLFH